MFFSAETDPVPCRVFDANGEEMTHVLTCDTDTGEVERLQVTDGMLVASPVTLRLLRIREIRPAPLRIEPPLPLTCDGFDL